MPDTVSPERRAWHNMRTRCANPHWPGHRYYGGRGISIDPRWESFETFLADMGSRPVGTSLERIDNDQGYGPDNCKWATRKEQQRNTSRNVYVEHDGVVLTTAGWAERTGLNVKTLRKRLQMGWTPARALQESTRA